MGFPSWLGGFAQGDIVLPGSQAQSYSVSIVTLPSPLVSKEVIKS